MDPYAPRHLSEAGAFGTGRENRKLWYRVGKHDCSDDGASLECLPDEDPDPRLLDQQCLCHACPGCIAIDLCFGNPDSWRFSPEHSWRGVPEENEIIRLFANMCDVYAHYSSCTGFFSMLVKIWHVGRGVPEKSTQATARWTWWTLHLMMKHLVPVRLWVRFVCHGGEGRVVMQSHSLSELQRKFKVIGKSIGHPQSHNGEQHKRQAPTPSRPTTDGYSCSPADSVETVVEMEIGKTPARGQTPKAAGNASADNKSSSGNRCKSLRHLQPQRKNLHLRVEADRLQTSEGRTRLTQPIPSEGGCNEFVTRGGVGRSMG